MLSEKGVTLPEMMVSAAALIILLLVFGTVFNKGNNLSDVLSTESKVQRNNRKVLGSIAASLRQARRAQVSIPSVPNNTQISFDLPIYQLAGNSCSAFASVADGTSPVSCASDANCVTSCGGNVADTFCVSQICRRTYTYSVNVVNSELSQVVVSSSNEASRVIGNQVGTMTFQNNSMDANLQPSEIRILLTTTGQIVSEKRTRNLTLNSVVQVKN